MLVRSLSHARYVFRRFLEYPWTVADTETQARPEFKMDKALRKDEGAKDALAYGRMQINFWSICHKGESYSFVTNVFDPRFPSMSEYLSLPEFQSLIQKLIVFHNANYDWMTFHTEGKIIFPKSYCTMTGCWMGNPGREKGLKARAPFYARHLHKTSVISFSDIDDASVYAEEDVVVTDEIYQMQRFGKFVRPKWIRYVNEYGKIIRVRNPMPQAIVTKKDIPQETLGTFEKKFLRIQELPYLRTTFRSEVMGFPFNLKRSKVIRKKIIEKKSDVLRRLYKIAGQPFNMASPQQKAAVLAKLKIDAPHKTKTGKISVNAASLIKMQMAGGHKFLSLMQEYSSLDKLSKFVDPYKGLDHYVSKKGRIHASVSTVGAVTGRTSCSNPNLTQIPSRKDLFGIKDCFEPPKGYSLVCLDHAALELRIMAILSGERSMADALNDPDRDLHSETAEAFNVDRDPTAKQLNFLLQYAGLAWALAEKLTVEGVPTTPEQAQVYIDVYAVERPRVLEFREKLLWEHEKLGYIRMLTGRKRWLTEEVRWHSNRDRHRAETTLSNNVVQGSGQDILKASVLRCDWKSPNPDRRVIDKFKLKPSFRAYLTDRARELDKIRRTLKKVDSRFALQVHDEAIYFVRTEAAEECANLIGRVMCWKHFFPTDTPYSVRLVVEGGVSEHSWKEAKGKSAPIKIHSRADYI